MAERRPARRRDHLLAGLWAALVAVLLLLPGDVVRSLPEWGAPGVGGADKAGHLLLFFLTALLWRRSWRHLTAAALPLAVVAAGAYAALLEVLQWWAAAGRTAELWDGAAGAAGALLYAAAALLRAVLTPDPPAWRSA